MILRPPSSHDDGADDAADDERRIQNVIPPERLEQGLIADCIISHHMPGEVPFLRPEHFFLETDRAAWQALIELDAMGCTGDIETLVEHLQRTAHVAYVDWLSYCVHAVSDPFPLSPLNFEHDARTMLDYALRRAHIREHQQRIEELYDLTVPLAESGLVNMNGVVHTLAEAYEEIPPVNWLVDKILAPGSVVLLYGKPATKKTYSTFSIAACVANGKDWLGFKTRQAAVLIVDQESTDRRIKLRLRECVNGVGGDQTAPIAWVTMQGYKLNNRADIAKIQQIKREHHIELIIIDSLSKHMDGDENSVKDTAPAMDGLRELSTNPDTAVLAIHHSQKTGEAFRGSSSIAGSVDMMIRVDSEQGSSLVNFTMEKNRDGELLKWSARAHWVRLEGEPEKDQFYMEPAEGRREEGVEKEETQEPVLNQAEQYIVRYLQGHGECSRAQIMQEAEPAKRGSVSNGLYALLGRGIVRRVNPEEKGQQAARFTLADHPDEDQEEL